MSTHEQPTGPIVRREVEIPATPEQVWQAIATAGGHAGWLFPAEIEEREGGAMVMHRQPFGGDAPATVTAYEPPHRFAFEEPVEMPGATSSAPWATEFLVEGRAGGVTVVRLVSGFYEGGEGWEDMVEGAGEGWDGALQILRAYVLHFLGQPVVNVGVTGNTGQPLDERPRLSRELLGALDLNGLSAGDKYRGPADAPPLAGVVETGGEHGYLVRTDEPGPGIFEISTFSMDGQTLTVNVVGHLYGEGLRGVADRDERRWADWLQQHFPAVGEPLTVPR